MVNLKGKPYHRQHKRRAKPSFKVFNQSGFLSTFLFIIFIIIAITAAIVYSDEAKPGDILYPIDRASEGVELSFTAVNPEEKLVTEQKQAKERLVEAQQLVELKQFAHLKQVLEEYNQILKNSQMSLNQARFRAREIQEAEPNFVRGLIDHLEALTKMYDSLEIAYHATIDESVQLTAQVYQEELEKLRSRRGDLDYTGMNFRYYEVQQQLRGRGIVIP